MTGLLSDSSSDCRMEFSAIGPRTKAKTKGAGGMSSLRITYPSSPKTTSRPTSKIDKLTLETPTTEISRIAGYNTLYGVFNSFAKNGTMGRFITSRAMLPRYMLAMMGHTTSACSWNSSGPGLSPYSTSAPRSTAPVPDPGIPMVNNGTIAPPVSELLAASGAATPSIEPLPNSSGVLDVFLAMM